MNFISIPFFLLTAVCVVLYYRFPKRLRWTVLLAGSMLFYLVAAGGLVLYFIGTILTAFFGALVLERIRERQKVLLAQSETRDEKKAIKAQADKQARRVLVLVLVINFGYLILLKYLNAFSSGAAWLCGLVGLPVSERTFDLVMPLGVSFYTFQAMGYEIDVYRGKVAADRNLLKFALFLSFFPQIVQGPIARHSQLAHQLYEGNDFDYDNLRRGALLAMFGIFKKLVIADRAAVLVAAVFDTYPQYTGTFLMFAAVFYTLQLYCDFSGGIDIAAGVSLMFGVELAKNFERPYFSKNIPEFWRRWHMSLGTWCRDYIFYPMSLSKPMTKLSKKCRKVMGNTYGKMVTVILCQLVSFVIIGLWHGAQFMHAAFGLYHAGLIILGIFFEPLILKVSEKLRVNPDSKLFQAFQILRTLFLVMMGRFFSRASGFRQGASMMIHAFVPNFADFTIWGLGLTGWDYAILAAATAVLFCISLAQERGYSVSQAIFSRPLVQRWCIYLLIVILVVLMGAYGPGYNSADFIYMGY